MHMLCARGLRLIIICRISSNHPEPRLLFQLIVAHTDICITLDID